MPSNASFNQCYTWLRAACTIKLALLVSFNTIFSYTHRLHALHKNLLFGTFLALVDLLAVIPRDVIMLPHVLYLTLHCKCKKYGEVYK